VLLPKAEGVEIVRKPSWFTPQRLLISLAILLAVLTVAVGWTVLVARKNSALNTLIIEKEAAQHELLEAHAQLEERVKERTAQLKFQITARKESELQSKATLAERTRLAQELHDTLGQTLTGVALQLDTTAKLFEQEPDGANHHLEVARNLIAQSQTEVRHSVWNLRIRSLEQFDLPSALKSSSRQLTDGTSIHVEVTARGQVRPLPEVIEENLLRIAQEALTNVIKHSGATSAEIELDYGPCNVVMHIKDNGRGFVMGNRTGPDQGHFGLLGISERIKRIRGEAVVESIPDRGTIVRVQAPLDPVPEVQNPELNPELVEAQHEG
jgi:signal transduction histidine kinase